MVSVAGVQIVQINSKEIFQGQVSLIVFAVSQLLLHARMSTVDNTSTKGKATYR